MKTTLRRTIQQAIHCLQEAESVILSGEDMSAANDDIDKARLLINDVFRRTTRVGDRGGEGDR